MPHSPGPWTVTQSSKTVYIARDDGHAKTYVAEVSLLAWPVEATTRQADAHLIAAAPDLLEALQRVVQYFNDDEGAMDYGELQSAIDSAIAKAEAR